MERSNQMVPVLRWTLRKKLALRTCRKYCGLRNLIAQIFMTILMGNILAWVSCKCVHHSFCGEMWLVPMGPSAECHPLSRCPSGPLTITTRRYKLKRLRTVPSEPRALACSLTYFFYSKIWTELHLFVEKCFFFFLLFFFEKLSSFRD